MTRIMNRTHWPSSPQASININAITTGQVKDAGSVPCCRRSPWVGVYEMAENVGEYEINPPTSTHGTYAACGACIGDSAMAERIIGGDMTLEQCCSDDRIVNKQSNQIGSGSQQVMPVV